MHLPIPCGSNVEIPSFLGFSSKFSPSSTSTCSLFLLLLIGFALFGLAVSVRFALLRKTKRAVTEGEHKLQKSEKEQVQNRSWKSIISAWDSVNLPVTLTAPLPPSTLVGRGVGLNGAVLAEQISQPIRSRPTFEQPLPAIYQSKEPVSMAKMIMSRHTFRRPSQSQRISVVPRRSTSLPPASSSRPQYMVWACCVSISKLINVWKNYKKPHCIRRYALITTYMHWYPRSQRLATSKMPPHELVRSHTILIPLQCLALLSCDYSPHSVQPVPFDLLLFIPFVFLFTFSGPTSLSFFYFPGHLERILGPFTAYGDKHLRRNLEWLALSVAWVDLFRLFDLYNSFCRLLLVYYLSLLMLNISRTRRILIMLIQTFNNQYL